MKNLAYILHAYPWWLLLYGAAAWGVAIAAVLLFNYRAHRLDRSI